MKKNGLLPVCALLLWASTACKKNAEPVFRATGYWTGIIYSIDSRLLNRNDGTCRLYMGVPENDTSGTSSVLEGRYLVNGEKYEARLSYYTDTMYIKSIKTAPGYMQGQLRSISQPGIVFTFEFYQ